MLSLLFYSLITVGYLFIFFMAGCTFPRKYLTGSLTMTCIYGFLVYYGVFQVTAFPMKLFSRSLTELTIVWAVLILLLLVFVVVFRRCYVWECCRSLWKTSWQTKLFFLLILIGVSCMAIVLGTNVNALSEMDAAYAIGTPTSTVYSDTLEQMSPYTGLIRDSAEPFYMLNTDMLQSAIVCRLSGILPLAERKWSFTIAMFLMFEMGLYQISALLGKGNREKQGVFLLLSNLVLFFSFSYSGVAAYLSYRTYEGKAIVCYFITMVILLLCIFLYQEKQTTSAWIGLFFCSLGAIAFTNTAMFIVPLMIGFTLMLKILTDVGKKRKIMGIVKLIIVLMPSLMWMIIYKLM